MSRAAEPQPTRSPETDLARMLATLEVEARAGEYVFVTAVQPERLPRALALATIEEAEGLTCVLRREDADAHGLSYDFVAAWLSLSVHSALQAVGLTAAVSQVLAERGIACNVLAGFHHDHLLVPSDRRDEAIAALHSLRRANPAGGD
ncbi:ACT domain-containing protein [Lysobacter sp. ESA13C]|uniref:ACT domain-containing protein n=1 Tax=Lysobacter sp. ESA13C TaxID=2862676 RepID=UPI001CBEC71B|nr:ACT domain-containing protein [Lysobacter sp. ESA13C]